MLPPKTMRKVDVVLSSALFGLGILVINAALGMPWDDGRTGGDSAWFLSPGIFPLVIGAMISAFSLRVLYRAISEGGHKGLLNSFRVWFRNLPTNTRIHRVATVFLLIGIYIFGLIGRIDYYIGTILFLFVFMMLFYRPWTQTNPWRSTIIVVATSTIVPVTIGYVFSTYLYVPLP